MVIENSLAVKMRLARRLSPSRKISFSRHENGELNFPITYLRSPKPTFYLYFQTIPLRYSLSLSLENFIKILKNVEKTVGIYPFHLSSPLSSSLIRDIRSRKRLGSWSKLHRSKVYVNAPRIVRCDLLRMEEGLLPPTR